MTVDVRVDEGDGVVGRITLARPEKLNALSRAVLEELAAAVAWFDGQPAVPVDAGDVEDDLAANLHRSGPLGRARPVQVRGGS